MKVTKAVIPAAGLGTRVLPASKAVPKEMLPIVDKPAIQYIVEEAVAAGITDILVITSRGKSLIEDHFDHAPIAAYEEYGKCVVGIKRVSLKQITKYCTLGVKKISDHIYDVYDMIEKPTPDEVISDFAILGRCLLTSDIFDLLEKTPPSRNGEIQLTDAMRVLARRGNMMGVEYSGTRYDMGNKLGILQATVEVGLSHPEIGSDFRDYFRDAYYFYKVFHVKRPSIFRNRASKYESGRNPVIPGTGYQPSY